MLSKEEKIKVKGWLAEYPPNVSSDSWFYGEYENEYPPNVNLDIMIEYG